MAAAADERIQLAAYGHFIAVLYLLRRLERLVFEYIDPTLHYERLRALARHRIADVVCGWSHTMCLTDEGAVYTWGKGQDGQLGHGTTQDEPEPRLVSYFGAHHIKVVALAGGYFHSAALSRRFQLYTWGCGEYGQLGHPCTAPAPAPAWRWRRCLRLAGCCCWKCC